MGTTTYVWDPIFDCVTHELDENNDVKAVYHNEPQQYGGVLSQRRGTTSHYHHHDALGSTRFLTDSSGNVTDTYLHDAWGNLVASTGTTVNPFKWVGKYGYYTNDITAHVYVRARIYQPSLARWRSVDPKGFVDEVNLYAYCAAAVLIRIDPSGEASIEIVPGYEVPSHAKTDCKSKFAKGGFKFRLSAWPCGNRNGVYVQQITASWDFCTCTGDPRWKKTKRFLEFFPVQKPGKIGSTVGVPLVFDYSGYSWDGLIPSFNGTRGWIEHDRLVRFYCVEKRGNNKRNPKDNSEPGVIWEDEIPTVIVDDPDFDGDIGTTFDPTHPPDFWKRSDGKAGEAEANWILDWDCCCNDDHVTQYFDPPIPPKRPSRG